MALALFEMERMQSTWENLVDYDLSESGVHPVTLRELCAWGVDLDHLLDAPLGYSQSNGTPELRSRIASLYPGATPEHVEVTNGTSEANLVIAFALLRPGDAVAIMVPNYMQLEGIAKGMGADVLRVPLRPDAGWEPDWEIFTRSVTPKTRLLYLTNPSNPTGAILKPRPSPHALR